MHLLSIIGGWGESTMTLFLCPVAGGRTPFYSMVGREDSMKLFFR